MSDNPIIFAENKMTGRVYGYGRVSTPKQNLERQIRNIKCDYPDAIIITDKYTGTQMDRPGWVHLLKILRSGDRIVFDSVSRMSRNAAEGFEQYKELMERGVSLVFLKEHHVDTDELIAQKQKMIQIEVDSGDAANDTLINGMVDLLNQYMMLKAERDIELAFEQANKEVDDLHQRVKEGLAVARSKGTRIGGVPGKHRSSKKEAAMPVIRRESKEFGGTLTDVKCLALLKGMGISLDQKTYYKYKKEIREEISRGAVV